ncbi:hypothetical protein OS493_030497 [Desmophyllum pertusum]|uniref:VWFA domain-containing protein n=1 Tax=Desmophyllum pertusum TaxID=174260 RepID=A0A9W9YK27_9CNID|nr:hypothetical protein OS493_030497 [Desmophyllum pertusum]
MRGINGNVRSLLPNTEGVQNSGECPPLQWRPRCSLPVTHECAVDIDCGESGHKCCYNGCYMTCQTAVKRKLRNKQKMCATPLDLVFMIDSSESVGLENFNKIKKMVDKTLTLFTISAKQTHVGVIMIDSVPRIELNLNTLQGNNITHDHVMRVVDGLEFISGQTRIDLALRMARKEVFSKAGGMRENVRKKLAFTQPNSSDNEYFEHWTKKSPSCSVSSSCFYRRRTDVDRTMLSLKKESQTLMKTGVEIFPVAVWAETLNMMTLLDIAPNSRNIFNTDFLPRSPGITQENVKTPLFRFTEKERLEKGVEEFNQERMNWLTTNLHYAALPIVLEMF